MSKRKSHGSRPAAADHHALRGPAAGASAAQGKQAPGPAATLSAPDVAPGPASGMGPAASPPGSPALGVNPQPVDFDSWPKDEPARWVIGYTLETLGLLHLGNGVDSLPDAPKLASAGVAGSAATAAETGSANTEQVEPIAFIAAMWQADIGDSLHAWLPGSSLKGALLARAEACALDEGLQRRLFGRERQPAEITEASPLTTVAGIAEFQGAVGPAATTPRGQAEQPDAAAPPQTRPPPPFEIETRTAIDRATLTVADGKLFQEQTLPPGSRFEARIVLPNALKADAQALCALLQGIDCDSPLTLGAHGRSGWGRVKQTALSLRVLGEAQARQWWDQAATGPALTGWESFAANCSLPAARMRPQASTLRLPLTLNFDGPFAVRDPSYKKALPGAKDSQARARHGHPLLPATSFLGALRSQAERILRTLGVDVPQGHAAPAVRTGELPQDLVSLLFGCTGWRGLVGASGDFVGVAKAKPMTQHMVALCRITGTAGGTAGAKFALECWESPVLKGELYFDQQRFAVLNDKPQGLAALGLLHLVLAELAYGDIGFGMARSKGWGWIKEDDKLLSQLDTNWWAVLVDARLAGGGQPSIHQDLLQALHKHAGYTPPENHDLPVLANVPHPASPAAEERLPTLFRGPGKAGQEFHNPYHFLPFARLRPVADATADLGSVANLPRDAERLKHSHDRYHQQRFSGRLVVNLTTKTPLFIGAERGQDQGDDPVPVSGFEFDGQPAIPGTSLRGMLGALIEPMSGSAMRIIDAEQMLSVRLTLDDASLPLRERGVIAKVRDQQGVTSLRIKHQAKTDSKPMYYAIPDRAAELLYALADERWRAVGKDLALDTEAQRNELRDQLYQKRDPAITTGSGRRDSTKKGQVVLLPAIDWDNLNDFGWPRNTDVDKPKSQARLMPHQVVYFRWDGPSQGAAPNKPVAELAWSQVYRRTCWVEGVPKPGPLNLSRQVQLENINRLPLGLRPNPRLHAAEWLLGAVEQRAKASSTNPALVFASKLSVGMARSASAIERLPPTVLKELSSPKPPSPALYLRRNGPVKGGISKAELLKRPKNFVFQGTKVYLHALRESGAVAQLSEFGDLDHEAGKSPWATQRPAEAPSKADEDKDYHLSKRQASVGLIDTGESFSFTIRFTNLSTDELGLLCAAVHPSENFEHHLGMGRPVGLGSIKLSLGKLDVIDRDQRLIDGSEALVGQDPQILAAQAMMKLKDDDRAFWRGLLLLGEPGRVRCPVHYPQVTPGTLPEKKRDGTQPPAMKGRIENLNYQWWVANDSLGTNGQALKPLAEIPASPEAGR